MVIRTIFFGLILFGCSKTQDGSEQLELKIINNEIYLNQLVKGSHGERLVNITYSLVNKSRNDIMLYNFRRYIDFGMFEEGLECDSSWNSNGKTLYLLTDSLKFKAPAWSIPDSLENDIEAVKRQFTMAKEWYRNSRVIIKKGEVLEFNQTIDLRNYNLRKGLFYIRMLYMHIVVPTEITLQEVESDLGNANTYMFNGCLWSNTAKLIVK